MDEWIIFPSMSFSLLYSPYHAPFNSIYKNQAENTETSGCQAGETTPSPQSRHHRKSSGVLLKLSY